MSTMMKKGQIQNITMIQSLTVISGRLWMTQAHDSEDYVLTAGDCFFATPHSQVLIEALEDSQIIFSEPSEIHHRKLTELQDSDRLKKRHVS